MSARGRAVAAPRARLTPRALILVALVLLVGMAAVVPVRQYLEQRDRIEALERQVDELRAERIDLERRIDRFKDPEYLERLARLCLGMVKPGEIAVVIPGGRPPAVC